MYYFIIVKKNEFDFDVLIRIDYKNFIFSKLKK